MLLKLNETVNSLNDFQQWYYRNVENEEIIL